MKINRMENNYKPYFGNVILNCGTTIEDFRKIPGALISLRHFVSLEHNHTPDIYVGFRKNMGHFPELKDVILNISFGWRVVA